MDVTSPYYLRNSMSIPWIHSLPGWMLLSHLRKELHHTFLSLQGHPTANDLFLMSLGYCTGPIWYTRFDSSGFFLKVSLIFPPFLPSIHVTQVQHIFLVASWVYIHKWSSVCLSLVNSNFENCLSLLIFPDIPSVALSYLFSQQQLPAFFPHNSLTGFSFSISPHTNALICCILSLSSQSLLLLEVLPLYY